MNRQTQQTLAFLRTGLMGAPIVRRLLGAGFRVLVWNRSPQKTDSLLALGAEVRSSPAAAARDANLTCLCLTDAYAASEVVLGPEGVARGAGEGHLVVDFSTLGPGSTREIAAALRAQCGARWVDAPVSGGVAGAEAGTLVVFCGGEEAEVRRAMPLFDALARRVTHFGALGAGQAAKLCNQLIVANNLIAIAEALALARTQGLNAEQIPAALSGGWADSLPLQIFGPRMATGHEEPKVGTVALLRKDVEEITRAADGSGLQITLTHAAAQIYRRAIESGLANEDFSALARLYAAEDPSGK